MMPDIAFAIKFIVLLTAFIAGFSVAIYAFVSVVAAFRKLSMLTRTRTLDQSDLMKMRKRI